MHQNRRAATPWCSGYAELITPGTGGTRRSPRDRTNRKQEGRELVIRADRRPVAPFQRNVAFRPLGDQRRQVRNGLALREIRSRASSLLRLCINLY